MLYETVQHAKSQFSFLGRITNFVETLSVSVRRFNSQPSRLTCRKPHFLLSLTDYSIYYTLSPLA